MIEQPGLDQGLSMSGLRLTNIGTAMRMLWVILLCNFATNTPSKSTAGIDITRTNPKHLQIREPQY